MAELHVRREGRLGRISLSRPEALNALSHEMVLGMERALREWIADDRVHAVLVDAEGGRAFCAGGDVLSLVNRAKQGDVEFARQFWRDEYRLNSLIGRYPKPYIAIMDGITMGGGVGIAGHAAYRVVTERAVIAMPESAIGLIPDVGGTWLLAQAPGSIGEYLAMTGARLSAGDAIYSGFADYMVPSDGLGDLIQALIDDADTAALEFHALPSPESAIAQEREFVDACFAAPSAHACAQLLDQSEHSRAAEVLTVISRNSPLSMAVGHVMVHIARELGSLEQCLALEFRFTYRSLEQSDFSEGVRAMLIDKDRKPGWMYPDLGSVPPEKIEMLLAELGPQELAINQFEVGPI